MLEFLETKVFWITAVVVAIYLYLKYYVYNYWQRHGVPCEPPSIPLGNIPFSYFLSKTSVGNFIKENYVKFCEHPFHGFYTFHKPAIVINDPELIRIILVKEFQHFHDRGWFHNDKIDELSANLFILPGEKWKKLRVKLSPIFTSGKLKQMYPLFTEVSNTMIDVCEAELKQSKILEMKNIIGRYTADIISSVVYGLKSNSLKNPKDEFRLNAIKANEFGKLSLLTGIFAPEFQEILNQPLFQDCARKFFTNIFKDMVDFRRKEKIVRKDFLNLLMQLMDNGEVEDDEEKTTSGIENNLEKLDMTLAAAQAFIFFIAGFETASSTATYALLELAMNSEIQDKLREEVDQMAESTGINYDNIMGNEYLEMVLTETLIMVFWNDFLQGTLLMVSSLTNIDNEMMMIDVFSVETLRKHPSVPVLNRICVEDFPIPNSNYTIPKGMRVILSVSGIHRNPKFYPNPEKFDPSRFSQENVAERSNYINLGFGEGPRFCIGKRFGQLEAKQAIVTLLRNYKFYISEKTQIPVKYSSNTFVQYPESGVYLCLEKRNL